MVSRPDYITVGRFGRPRGVTGELYITPDTDFPDRFLDLFEVYIEEGGKKKSLIIESAEIISGRPVVKVEGIESKEEAAALTNLAIFVPGEQAVELPEGSYYQFDLVGSTVKSVDGVEFGVLEEILFYPANDVYRIKSKDFGEILLPVVDKFVKGVDIEKKEIIIEPPDGLIESSS
ncbi:MAG: ribosome maturation factor RimM [Candidatus Zixiibacteriota bacterium]